MIAVGRTRAAEKFGRLLRRARHERAWSQQELSDRSGVIREHISDLENGKYDPRLSTIGRLAKALGLRVTDLLG